MWPRSPIGLSRLATSNSGLIVRRTKPTPGHPARPSGHLRLPRLHHRPRRRHLGARSRSPPPRGMRGHHQRPQIRRRSQPSPLGSFRGERGVDGLQPHRPQPGPLGRAHRDGQRSRPDDDQDATDPAAEPARADRQLRPQTNPSPADPVALERPVQHHARKPARRHTGHLSRQQDRRLRRPRRRQPREPKKP